MLLFDPHIHMTSRTTDDYRAMAEANVRAVLEPAFWLGQPRTHVGSFEDYFASLLGWERFRASQYGIHHFCALALNPKEANNAGLARDVLEILPRWLQKDGVLALGEIGLDECTAAEERAFSQQLEMARQRGLPVLVHTPHRDKLHGTERILAIIREHQFPPERVLIDHNMEDTVRMVMDSGCYAGHSIYPDTKMDEARMVKLLQAFGTERMMINSAADWGQSDPLKVPKTASRMRSSGMTESDIETVVWHNPIAFFCQSNRLPARLLERPAGSDLSHWQGNRVERGEPLLRQA